MLNHSLTTTESSPVKSERTKKTLSRVALFLGELRDGLTMVSSNCIKITCLDGLATLICLF